MADAQRWMWLRLEQKEVAHAARSAIAAVASLLIARSLRLPDAYWAAIATLIAMQSTLGAAWAVSRDRLIGTAMGAAAGALLATYTGENMVVFGAGVFTLGLLCPLLHVQRGAYRYAGITLVIVMMIARTEPAWITAIHRFIEISVGLAVGLILTAMWPETEQATA